MTSGHFLSNSKMVGYYFAINCVQLLLQLSEITGGLNIKASLAPLPLHLNNDYVELKVGNMKKDK